MTFTIPGRLDSLNQSFRVGKSRFWQSRRRQHQKRMIAGFIYAAQVPKFTVPVDIHIRWVERDLRRDEDNIRSGAKVVLDALVVTGTIVNDSRKWCHIKDSYAVDKENPRIEVTITESVDPMHAVCP